METLKNIRIFAILVFTFAILSGFSQNRNEDFIKGKIVFEKGNSTEAVSIMQTCIASGKNSDLAYKYIGLFYFEKKDYQQAKTYFYKANEINKSIASFELARVFALLHQPDSAVIMLEDNLNSQYKLSRPKITLEKDFENIQTTNQWKALWEKQWYSPKEVLLTEAEGLIGSGSFESALDLLDEYLAKRNDHSAQYLRAQAFYGLQNSFNAIRDLDEAIKAKNNQPEYYKLRGIVFLEEGKLKKAAADFSVLIINEKYSIDGYFLRAKALFLNNKFAEAETDITYYLSVDKYNPEAWFFSSRIYAEQENLQKALKSVNSALAIRKDNAEYLFQRALVLYKMKSYSLAIKDISLSLDIFPESGESYLLSGKIKMELRDYENACKDLNKALRLKQMEAADIIQINCSKQ